MKRWTRVLSSFAALVVSLPCCRAAVAQSSPAPGAPPQVMPAPRASAPAAPASSAGAPAVVGDWAGLWMGRTIGPRTQDLILEIGEGEVPVVRVSMYGIGIRDEVARAVSTADGRLQGSWSPGVGTITFDIGRTEGSPDEAEGSLQMVPPGQHAEMSMGLRLVRKPRAESVKGVEVWYGTLDIAGTSLDIGLMLAVTPAGVAVGALDIPAQGAKKLPLDVERTSGAWNIRVPAQQPARLLLAPVEDRLEGRFQQGTIDTAIVFRKGGVAPARPAANRPQTPVPPFPYREEHITIPHPAGHTLAGTLTLPPHAQPDAPVPAVVLATGSGPQDRNETILGHQPFAVLADTLTRAGIAVLRFDDRGIGESTGDFGTASSLDFATDLEAAFDFATRQPGIDPKRVGLLGHSEGAILAVVVAGAEGTRAVPPAFVVLMAGSGVPGHAVLRRQNRALLEAAQVDAATVTALSDAHGAFLDAVVTGADDAAIAAAARELITLQVQQARRHGQQLPPGAEDAAVRQAVATMSSPWMKTFLALDPAVYIRRITVPLLVLIGLKDTQVVAEQNLPPMRAAMAGNPGLLTVREYAGLNHLFQRAETGGVAEYAAIETTIEPEVLRDIAQWIRQTTQVTTMWAPPAAPPAAR